MDCFGCRTAPANVPGIGAPWSHERVHLQWVVEKCVVVAEERFMSSHNDAGARLRAALMIETPLQIVGAITACAGLMARRVGYKALYLSGGGVAANSLGVPDFGISTMEDVLTDARRLVEATGLPLLVDIDTGWGGAFNIARSIRSFERVGAAAVHIEDQVDQKRCGHRPGKKLVPQEEMADRIKAAVDARNHADFVVMARTDAVASEGINVAIERAVSYVESGAEIGRAHV